MIDVSIGGAIAVVSFKECSPLGRHDAAFGRALRDAVRDSADDDRVKAIVLRAGSQDFCPRTAQPSATERAASWNEWRELYASATGLYQNIVFCRKVVIAAVSGQCGPAGTLLALCAGLAVAGDDAVFDSPFDDLHEANFVLAALTLRLNRAKAWVVRGHALPAAEAQAAGLVNRVVPSQAVHDAAHAMARRVTAMPLDGLAISRIALESYLDSQGVGREFDAVPFYAGGPAGSVA